MIHYGKSKKTFQCEQKMVFFIGQLILCNRKTDFVRYLLEWLGKSWYSGTSSIVTRLLAGWPRFDSWQGQRFLSSPWCPDWLWNPSRILVNGQISAGSVSQGAKWLEWNADSAPSTFKVKYTWSWISTPAYVFLAQCLIKHKENFTLSMKIKSRGQWNTLPQHLSYTPRVHTCYFLILMCLLTS
jgi:hypothetical protein